LFDIETSPISLSNAKQGSNSPRIWKKALVLSLLIAFALLCSCQKIDSTAEQQFAQWKTKLAAWQKAMDESEKALAKREKLVAKPRVPSVPRIARRASADGFLVSQRASLQIPRQVRAEPVQRMQEHLAERQRKMEEIQRVRAARALPRNQATAPATEQAASPSPSPTPE
jgi:hypothetical protein